MLKFICRIIFKKKIYQIIENKNKIEHYKSTVGLIETQLNDTTRKLINSVKGIVEAEKYINKSNITNLTGFMNTIQQKYPQLYSSENFRRYEQIIIKLEQDIKHEKSVVNKYLRYYNTDIEKYPIISKICGYEKIEIINWNNGRDINKVTEEYNNLNKESTF